MTDQEYQFLLGHRVFLRETLNSLSPENAIMLINTKSHLDEVEDQIREIESKKENKK